MHCSAGLWSVLVLESRSMDLCTTVGARRTCGDHATRNDLEILSEEDAVKQKTTAVICEAAILLLELRSMDLCNSRSQEVVVIMQRGMISGFSKKKRHCFHVSFLLSICRGSWKISSFLVVYATRCAGGRRMPIVIVKRTQLICFLDEAVLSACSNRPVTSMKAKQSCKLLWKVWIERKAFVLILVVSRLIMCQIEGMLQR